ncbi:MAG: radical SAM protein [Desulfovermiculus sp.]|nr:radical SAM protein [Desulfovermiculus sp.]
MPKNRRPLPRLVYADTQGQIYDHPSLAMLCRKGREILPPRPDECIPLPSGSDLFLLPSRRALGWDQETGTIVQTEGLAVAAFVCPGYTLSGLAAYAAFDAQCPLPLFAYGAIGFANGRFYLCARQVDEDPRQDFSRISPKAIQRGARQLLHTYPDNRLVRHLANCALTYGCPAAKNLALGRYEAPLPTAQACNAACVGCISKQDQDSGFPPTQERIAFRPTVQELLEIMRHHGSQESRPIFSFGQGCEGEPLTESELITKTVDAFRRHQGQGTVNINTNAGLPASIPGLARAGLDSIRVTLNSARKDVYTAYHRPRSYSFEDVVQCIDTAKQHGLFVSLNFLFFPGLSDTEAEYQALAELIERTRLDYIQWRNLNLDPELYVQTVPDHDSPAMGLKNFLRRFTQDFPWLDYGYFNPFVGVKPTPP